MSNAYSIDAGDIRGPLIDPTTYDQLATDPTTGTPLTSGEKQTVIDGACEEFASHVTGTFATAANLALAKPQALWVAVYAFHFRRAVNGDYKIPEPVAERYKAALEWAAGTGKALLAAEGTEELAGMPQVEYAAADPTHEMEDLDRL